MNEAPHIRLAEERDVPRIVDLYRELTITDSRIEHSRNPSPADYLRVFAEIHSDPRQRLFVAEVHGEVVGTIELLIVPNLSHNGTPFAFLENLTDYGLTCGTQVGTTQEAELDEVAPDSLRTYIDFLAALEAMKSGQIDSVYAETPITSNWILEAEQEGDPPIIVVFRRPYYPVAFVVHQDADMFLAKVNGALAEIIASGELDQLRDEWKT